MANNWLRYANQGATRNQPINRDLEQRLAQFLPDLGIQMEVFSGGQPGKGSGGRRVGSTRHDHGNAADVRFYKDGRQLNWANQQDIPLFQEIVSRGRAAGITGFGAGPGYMGAGTMHIGMGSPGVWGAGGRGANAPEWLRKAYGQSPGQISAPPLSAPRTIEDRPIVADSDQPSPTPDAPPQGLIDMLRGGGGDGGDGGAQANPILNALSSLAFDGNQPQAPEIAPMPQQQQSVPDLNEFINQYLASRMRRGGSTV